MSTSTSSTSNNEAVGIKYPLFVQALTFSPTGSQTIYFGNLPRVPTTSLNRSKIYPRETITITGVNIYTFASTAGSPESWPMYIRVNGTTDHPITTISTATNERIFDNDNLNVTVNEGEYFEIKMENPPWGTPPVSVVIAGNIFIKQYNLNYNIISMPLLKGKKNIGKNIKMEMKKHPNMSKKQAVAIALSTAKVKPKNKKK